jgi:uncharacterized protein (DUF1684 family)
MPTPSSPHLALADWRRRVAALYRDVRDGSGTAAARLGAFRAARDELFGAHPSSPVPAGQRSSFAGLAYFDRDEALVRSAVLEPDPDAPPLDVPRSGDGLGIPFRRIGWVSFEIGETASRLAVFWLDEYAGGIFIPFRDGTSGTETYGGGRYLWDSAKGADLGTDGDALVLDFNYAYHPSCTHDPIWSCPLAPRENWLTTPIRGGERLASDHA